MTTLAVDQTHKDSLAGQGYAINEWIGFSDHFVPLYAHHPVSDKKIGDVVFKVRVGDPRTLNNGEAAYIAKKASQGYFTWKPGADCLVRTFKSIEIRKRPGGGVERIESPPSKGCAWCRETTTPTLQEPVAQVPPLAVTAVSTAAESPAPVLPSYDVLHCAKCPRVFVGDNAMNERRGHMMRDHKKAAASDDAPRKGSGKES